MLSVDHRVLRKSSAQPVLTMSVRKNINSPDGVVDQASMGKNDSANENRLGTESK